MLYVFVLVIGLMGLLVIAVLAKLRSVQLEAYRIINNIRREFLTEAPHLWYVVEKSRYTLPKPTMRSGTYFWILMVVLVSAALSGFGVFLLSKAAWPTCNLPTLWALLAVGGLVVLHHAVYFRLAQAPDPVEAPLAQQRETAPPEAGSPGEGGD